MDLSRTRVVLRERAVVDVFDLALRFVVEHGAVYAKTSLVALPPFFVASVLVARAGGWAAAWPFAVFMTTFAATPFTVLASRLVFEDDVRFWPTFAQALRATPRIFALRVITFVAGMIGLCLMVAPAIWILAVGMFVMEVAILERAKTVAAVMRSMTIAGRESGEVIMAFVLLFILHGIAVVIADSGGREIITMLLEARAPAAMWTDGWSYLSLFGFWLFVPYAATARFLVYLDVRTRSEGWDIQTRFVALATRSLPEARTAA